MPDWFSNSYVVNIVSTVIGAIIVAVLFFSWKRIVAFLAFLWNRIRMGHRKETRMRPWGALGPLEVTIDSAHSLDLRFVEFFSFCGVQQHKDGRWLGQIQTQWDVTNVSKSRMPASLLRARLAKPRLADARPQFGEARGDVIIHTGDDIPANGKRKRITIHFFPLLPPYKLKSLTLHIVVIDQLNNEHSLPPITVKPQIAPPPTEGQT